MIGWRLASYPRRTLAAKPGMPTATPNAQPLHSRFHLHPPAEGEVEVAGVGVVVTRFLVVLPQDIPVGSRPVSS